MIMAFISDVVWWLLAIYVVSVIVFIIMENRTPQSTFAWLFLMFVLPLVGLLIYIFFGRTWHVFAAENDLTKQDFRSDLMQDFKQLAACQDQIIERLAKEKPESYKKRLLNLVKNHQNSILTGYNRVEILQNASSKYPRLLDDIRNANQYIHLNYYIWTEDEFTLQVKASLIERARAGIEVRCLYDASGGAISKKYVQDLKDAGVEIHAYLDYRQFTRLRTINYRSHRKIAVIDGKIGYVGGLNLDKEQIDPPVFDTWRDTHLRMVGEAAWALEASFAVSWFNTTSQKLTGSHYYPPVETDHFLPVQITQSGPDSQWKGIRQLYFFMIMAAEEKVYLQSPFFIPDESIMEALKAASLAGVDVKLMFTPRGSTYQIPYRAANTYFKDIVEAGAKVYLYQAGYFHPKTLNIDNSVFTVGTANMDIRSFSINYETNAVVYDAALAKQLEAQFLEDLKHCEEWTLDAYKRRSPIFRFTDSLYRLASPIL